MRTRLLTAAVATFAILLCSLNVSAVGEKIVFVRSDTSGALPTYDLWMMNPDGGGLQRLTYLSAYSMSRPDWSPDGTKILFSADKYFSTTSNSANLMMLDMTNGQVSYISGSPPETYSCPCGSIQGNVKDYNGNAASTVAVYARGALVHTYTDYAGHFQIDNVPIGAAWVRAYEMNGQDAYGTCIIENEGDVCDAGTLSLKTGSPYKESPLWSHDGQKFTYLTSVMSWNGSSLTTSGFVSVGSPTNEWERSFIDLSPVVSTVSMDPDWSPVQDRIVYRLGDSQSGMYLKFRNSDGSNENAIACGGMTYEGSLLVTYYCYMPKWSPGGNKMAVKVSRQYSDPWNYLKKYLESQIQVADVTVTKSGTEQLENVQTIYNVTLCLEYDILGIAHLCSGFTSKSINYIDWSPDGSEIIFDISASDTNSTDVYSINVDGSDLQEVTSNGESSAGSWSPVSNITDTVSWNETELYYNDTCITGVLAGVANESTSSTTSTSTSTTSTSSTTSTTATSLTTVTTLPSTTSTTVSTTSTTSSTTSTTIGCSPSTDADANGDCQVSNTELIEFINRWLRYEVSDINLMTAINVWGTSTP